MSQIYIWQLIAGDLSGIAFIDTNVFIHQLATIKNLILVGDMVKSITLLRFQADLKVLSLVARVGVQGDFLGVFGSM